MLKVFSGHPSHVTYMILNANLEKEVISHSFGSDPPNNYVSDFCGDHALSAIRVDVGPLALVGFRDDGMK